jgi:hypothetical protein
MTGVLLNIGHDIVDILVKIIAYINEVRASSAPLKVILWPIMYGLTVVKVIIKVLANGSQKLYNDTIPSRIVILRVHTLTATPANIYCFNKRGFLLFFLEFYLFCFFFIYV